jgi:hypothetical protein
MVKILNYCIAALDAGQLFGDCSVQLPVEAPLFKIAPDMGSAARLDISRPWKFCAPPPVSEDRWRMRRL